MGLKIYKQVSGFKYGQIEIASKGFNKQKQVTDIRKIDVNKVMLSDRVPCNKYW